MLGRATFQVAISAFQPRCAQRNLPAPTSTSPSSSRRIAPTLNPSAPTASNPLTSNRSAPAAYSSSNCPCRDPPRRPRPRFTLADQTGSRISLSEFSGKVVAVTFIYTTCPLPDYCFRLSNNSGQTRKRLGSDLILLSITFDPVHDTPQVLARYAATWKADPQTWHFLTGGLDEVKAVCRNFGLNFWQDEGFLTPSMHALVIDGRGGLAADFEGNEFTAAQLADYLATLLGRQ